MRDRAGITLEEAARKLEVTKSALNRMECAETKIDIHLAKSMMDVYDIRDDEFLELAREATKPGWWRAFGIRDTGYVGMETEAAWAFDLSILNLPGLLQTEAYTRRLFEASNIKWTRREVENQIAARLIRQKRLRNGDNPLHLVALIDESALRRPMCELSIRNAQLRHLIEAADWPTVELRVLSHQEMGMHQGLMGAYTVLEFEDPEDPSVLYVEYPTGAFHVENPDEVAASRLLIENLRSAALSPEKSVALIERLIE